MSQELNTDTNSGSHNDRFGFTAMRRFHPDPQGHVLLCALLATATTAIGCFALRLNQTNGELRQQMRALEEIAGTADAWKSGREQKP